MKKMRPNCFIHSQFPAVAVAVFAVAQLASAQTTELWTAVPGTSADTNWSDNANWNSGSGTATANNDVFGLVGTNGTLYKINNVCDQNNINPNSLTFTNSNPGVFTTWIPAGVATTVATTLNVGDGVTPSAGTCAVVIEGPGGLAVNGAVTLNGAAASSTSQINLDMSQLGSFTNNAPTATMSIGTTTENNANLSLATNTIINVATINVETTGGSNGRTGNVYLGAGTNTIWANNINLGTGKAGTVNLTFTNKTGGVAIAGTGGTGRATMVVGDDNSGSSVVTSTVNLTNHTVNVLAGTNTLGVTGANDSGVGPGTGTIAFDTGLYDVTALYLGSCSSTGTGASASGVFTAGGNPTPNSATLIVNSPAGSGLGALVLGTTVTTGKTGNGTLNILTNCTAGIYCSITKSNATLDNATINLGGGGTLIMEAQADTIGTSAIPINTLNLKGGALVLSTTASTITPNAYVSTLTTSGPTTTIVITNFSGTLLAATSIPLINYTGADPGLAGLTVTVNPADLPAGYTASLTDTGSQIELTLTPSGPPPTIVIWTGATNGDWDDTTTNWAADGVPTNYVDGDEVQFDDTLLSNNIITLTTTLYPTNGITVTNNNEDYTFIGTGNIAIGTLSKQGSQALIIDNSGANTLNGTIIGGGALQIGNNDANGSLGSGPVDDNGALVLDRNDAALNLSGTIAGSGSVVDNGSGSIVTLSANNNSFSGGLVLNSGTVLAAQNGSISASSGTISFNGGALEYGIQAVVGMTNTADYSSRFSAAANQQYDINLPAYPDNDNTSPYASHIVTFTSALTSSGGSLTKSGYGELELTGTNTFNGGIFVNGGVIRANNTNSYGANAITETAPGSQIYFNEGTWTYPNNLSLQGYGALEADGITTFGAIRMGAAGVNLSGTITLTGDAGISARGAGTTGAEISGQITGPYGILFGRNSLTTSASSSVILVSNVLNNWTGDTTIADGTLKLGASGVIPNGSGFGNLVLTNAGTGYNASMANSVFDLNGYSQTINGLSHVVGTPSFNMLWVTNSGASPATLALGNGNANGDFGGIIGSSANPLSLAKIGTGTQTLGGVNTYNGNTAITAGTLALSGSGSIANSPDIIVAGGATFDVSSLAAPFALGSSQTLSNSAVGAVINGTNDIASGTLSLIYDGVNPSFSVANGGMTLSAATVLNVNNTGPALAIGAYTIITNAATGLVAGTVPASFIVNGNGIAAGTTNSLLITNGVLDLVITPLASPAVFTGISISGTTLTISATNGAAGGQFVLLGTTNLLLPLNQWTPILTNSFDGSGNLNLSTNVVDTNTPVQFYLLQMP